MAIYIGTSELKKAYIGYAREPGANTIAYFPLESDILDHAGNLTLTHGTMTQNTIGYRVNGGAKITTNGAVYYMGGWCNVQAADSYTNICGCDNPEMGYYYKHQLSTFNQKAFVVYSSNWSASTQSVSIGTNSRHHYAISYYGSKSYVYIDGVKKVEYNGIGYNFGNMVYLFSTWNDSQTIPNNGSGAGIISDFILESVGWSGQDVLNYYNNTKAKYGIS